jgi:hypothetical protein
VALGTGRRIAASIPLTASRQPRIDRLLQDVEFYHHVLVSHQLRRGGIDLAGCAQPRAPTACRLTDAPFTRQCWVLCAAAIGGSAAAAWTDRTVSGGTALINGLKWSPVAVSDRMSRMCGGKKAADLSRRCHCDDISRTQPHRRTAEC